MDADWYLVCVKTYRRAQDEAENDMLASQAAPNAESTQRVMVRVGHPDWLGLSDFWAGGPLREAPWRSFPSRWCSDQALEPQRP
jgi:hypothetical protein